MALGVAFLAERRQRPAFFFAGLLNAGVALYLLTDHYDWYKRPAWPLAVLAAGTVAFWRATRTVAAGSSSTSVLTACEPSTLNTSAHFPSALAVACRGRYDLRDRRNARSDCSSSAGRAAVVASLRIRGVAR